MTDNMIIFGVEFRLTKSSYLEDFSYETWEGVFITNQGQRIVVFLDKDCEFLPEENNVLWTCFCPKFDLLVKGEHGESAKNVFFELLEQLKKIKAQIDEIVLFTKEFVYA